MCVHVGSAAREPHRPWPESTPASAGLIIDLQTRAADDRVQSPIFVLRKTLDFVSENPEIRSTNVACAVACGSHRNTRGLNDTALRWSIFRKSEYRFSERNQTAFRFDRAVWQEKRLRSLERR